MKRLMFTLLLFTLFTIPNVYADDPRFKDIGDGTIHDTISKLTWLKNANCFRYNRWGGAMNAANELANGQCGLSDGSKAGDWHLPTLAEFKTFIDSGYRIVTLTAAGFTSIVTNEYYATSDLDSSQGLYPRVSMSGGDVGSGWNGRYDQYSLDLVWPVRPGYSWTFGPLIFILKQVGFPVMLLGKMVPVEYLIINDSADTSSFSAQIYGDNDFTVATGGSAPCASLTPTLAAGEKCTLSLEFTPFSKGAKTANLTIAANGKTLDIPITGSAYTTIYGKVVNMTTKAAIAGATVTITGGATTTSDANGIFTFTTPPANGTYTATISKTGFANTVVNGVIISDTKGAELNVGLIAPGSMNIASATPLLYGETGKPYDLRIPLSGGTAPFTLGKVYGSLPPGITLDATGLGGTPTTVGSYTFAISATDSASGYAEQEYTLAISAPLAVLTNAILTRATRGAAYTKAIIASGGTAPYTFSLLYGTLPTGLTLNSSTGSISGTVNAEAFGSAITVKVTDSVGRTTSKNFSLPVDGPFVISTPRLSDAIVGTASSQLLAATGGYPPYTWSIFSGQLPTSLTQNSATGAISGTATSAVSQQLVLSAQDSAGRVTYKQFTMNALNPLQNQTTTMPNAHVGTAYSELIRTNGGIGPYTFSYTGLVPSGLTLNATTGVISGTPTSAGYVNLNLTVTDITWPAPQSVTQALGVRTTSQLTITNSSILPTARQNAAMNPVTLTAAGGSSPYTWTQVGGALPAGLTFNTTTGTISGTPTGKGDFIFTVRVADSAGNATGGNPANPDKQFFIHVSAPLAVTTTLLPAAGVGIPFVAELQADGGQRLYSWSVATGTLPTGLTLSTEGVVSGTPTAKITSTVTFKVTDSDNPAQSAQKALTFKVFDSLTIQETSLPQARADQAYTTSLHAWLGVTPYSWRVSSGALPPGITLLQNAGAATLQGTPTTAGSYTFTIEATDSGATQQAASTEFTITVLPVFAITTPANLKSAVRTVAYSANIAASGGAPPYSFTILTGNLPDGLSLNPATGAISGITTDPAGQSSSFTVRVTDSGAPAAYLDKEFSIFAIDQLTITTATLPVVVQQSPYSAAMTATGGVSPFSWLVASGALPAGIVLDPASGTLSGTPSACGSFSFTAQVTDSTTIPATAQKALNIAITCMNGACGSSNTKAFSSAPTNNFCTAGTPSALSGAGPWTWTCQGLNGGTSANCSANLLKIAGDGNGDGVVTIAEVQSAINMFLGLNNVAGYVDMDGIGGVSIAEVQKVINGFLGL